MSEMREEKETKMRQEIEVFNELDENQNPIGGRVVGLGINIQWQNGPLSYPDGERREPNGAFVESVIQAAISRLCFYQDTKFKCRENALAITKLEEALHWLEHRTAGRVKRGVEGSHKV